MSRKFVTLVSLKVPSGHHFSLPPRYHDMRRLGGSAPTGGFGLGFDRLVQFLLGVTNIRDAVPFARTPYSCVL